MIFKSKNTFLKTEKRKKKVINTLLVNVREAMWKERKYRNKLHPREFQFAKKERIVASELYKSYNSLIYNEYTYLLILSRKTEIKFTQFITKKSN